MALASEAVLLRKCQRRSQPVSDGSRLGFVCKDWADWGTVLPNILQEKQTSAVASVDPPPAVADKFVHFHSRISKRHFNQRRELKQT